MYLFLEIHFFKQLEHAPALNCLYFIRYQSSKLLIIRKKVPLHPKPNIRNIRWKGCYFQYVLRKKTLLLHLELKIADYGESRTSASIYLTFTSHLWNLEEGYETIKN